MNQQFKRRRTEEIDEQTDIKPDLADHLMIKEKHRTDERFELVRATPFVAKAVENIINRGQSREGEPNVRRHDPTLKDTCTKFALTHGTAAAIELSTLVNGPSRATIFKECRATHPVLGWLDPDNLKEHVLTAQSEYSQYYCVCFF
jgi:hypothetical protein